MLDCIVSLTSWKGRINNPDLPKVLFSIFRQETKYRYKTILTLSEDEFPAKEVELPNIILDFVDTGYLELFWTKKNTRALKKLFPVMDVYNVPILTTDDDIILAINAVETFMDMHRKNPFHILTELGHKLVNNNEICTGTFRLFPQDSLYKLPDDYFMKYFKGYEDDVYLALLAEFKGTKTIIMKKGIAIELNNMNYNKTKMRSIYTKIPWRTCRRDMLSALRKEGKIGNIR